MKAVITIARQMGSGGSYVGRLTASHLGFRYADREILALAAKRLNLAEADVSWREERVKSQWDSILDVFALGTLDTGYTPPAMFPVPDEEIFAKESLIMRALAQRHDCVVIGRGGRHVFRDHPDAVHVFIHAPESFRIERVMRFYGARTMAQARSMIADSDRARAEFHARMTRADWTRAENYHLCVDTGGVPLEHAAELIIGYFKKKTARH
jgi:cytidylate kinase